jgi:hypothetical protein
VLQLRRDDFPELVFPDQADLCQVLWCPNDHEPLYAPACRVFWRRAAEVAAPLRQMPTPSRADDNYLPHPCVLHPERVTEYPDALELTEPLWERVVAWEASLTEQADPDDTMAYHYELSAALGTKLGGHVDWIQDRDVPVCACGRPMDHLLTIGSAEFDSSSWRRWCAAEEGDIWALPYQERLAVQSAADIMLGDMGQLYLFICPVYQDWPIAWTFQCS